MRLSSPDPNTKCGMGTEVLPSLDVCVVCVCVGGGGISVFSLSRVQVNMKMEGQVMVPGRP